MQELLGRISRLDPTASLALRVIACFDELVVGNVNTKGLLAAAAALAGCPAGFRQESPPRSLRVTPRGHVAPPPTPSEDHRCAAVLGDGMSVWLERPGEALPDDAIILERLALSVRIRHGRGRDGTEHRRELGRLVDPDVPVDQRVAAAGALGLVADRRYRVVAAPLFAVWSHRPSGPEDVVPSVHGPLHVVVVPDGADPVVASPAGIGTATELDQLHRSYRTAVIALRLAEPPQTPVVHADDYGALIGVLAESSPEGQQSEVDRLDEVASQPWGRATVEAVIRSQSVRQAARAAGVHHSTMQARLDLLARAVGYDPLDGYGKPRLGLAFLLWRLQRSRVLDLPAPGAKVV